MAKLITKTFDNLYEYREFAEKCAKEENYSIVSRVKREAGRNDFYGNLKFEDTIEAMKYGIKDYTSYFLENIADTTSEEDGWQGIFMDIEGFAYDMGAVVSGEPECCINWNDVAPTKVINIIVDISFNCGTSATEIKNRGVAIANLINTLLTKKYIVNLEFLEYNTQSDIDTEVLVKVDTSNLSIATIAMMCSTEYFRQVGFVTLDDIRHKESESGRGQGEMNNTKLNEWKDKGFFIGGSYNDSRRTYNGCYRSIKSANETIEAMFNEYCKNH